MPVTEKEVERIADLANLEFEPKELGLFAQRFQEILDYFNQLETVPTDDVEPMYHALLQEEVATPSRSDEVGASLSAEAALREAPDAVDNQFRVPRVID